MKKILIDARVLIEDPKILGLKSEQYELFTTDEVVDEVRESGNFVNISYQERLQLIESAVQFRSITILPTNTDELYNIKQSLTSPRLSNGDKSMLAYILQKQAEGETFYLVTKSKLLRKFAANLKIELITLDELRKILSDISEEKDNVSNINDQIAIYEWKEKRKIIFGFFIGAILSYLAYLTYDNIQLILDTTNVWSLIALIIVLSFSLYIIREKWRLPYGFLEFSVGVFSVIIVFFPVKFNLTEISFDSTFFIKVIGGLYIMVRGIDNMMIAVENTRFGIFIRRLLTLDKKGFS